VLNYLKGADSTTFTECLGTENYVFYYNYFENPKERFEEFGIKLREYMMASLITPLQEFYPELKNKDSFINLIVNDLYNKGILSVKDLNCAMTSSGMYCLRLTEYGMRFLRYIKYPQI